MINKESLEQITLQLQIQNKLDNISTDIMDSIKCLHSWVHIQTAIIQKTKINLAIKIVSLIASKQDNNNNNNSMEVKSLTTKV